MKIQVEFWRLRQRACTAKVGAVPRVGDSVTLKGVSEIKFHVVTVEWIVHMNTKAAKAKARDTAMLQSVVVTLEED